MSNTRIRMLNLQHLIRLKIQGQSNRSISKMLSIHRNSVNTYVRFFDTCGQTYESLSTLDEQALCALVQSGDKERVESSRYEDLSALFPYYEKELRKVGATYEGLWSDYRMRHADGYGCTRFKAHLKAYLNKREVSLVRMHPWGESLFVDFSGQKLSVTNRLTGCVESKEVFVALLGGSQYTYVEAVEDQSLTSFCEAVQNALHYFGGVPRSIVPDNLKSAVTKADRYEAEVNQNFKALALHYHTVVLPTRAYKPKDKALVEGCVRLMYQRIFYPLSNQTFFSLTDLNQAIVPLLEAHNHKPFSKGGTLERGVKESRADLFQAYEKAELRPLPVQRYELRTYKEGKVAKNSHVWFGSDKHYYSVPYRYVGSNMLMVATEHSLEIYLRATHERVAVHKRNKGKVNGFTTTEAHLPPNIQFVKNWSVETFEQQAAQIHVDLVPFIQKVFHTQAHPQQACTICMGILGLKKHFDTARLVKACQRAAYFDNYTYRAVKSILTQQLDQVEWRHLKDTQQENAKPLFDLPINHPNIRGSIYYY